jgi:hypothetical protein
VLPIHPQRPHNLRISRQVAILIAVMSVVAGVTAMIVVISIFGIAEGSTPIMVSLASALATAVPGLIAALKSTESADSASKAQNTAEAARRISELTASQTVALQMQFNQHCGEVCPAKDCPLRDLVR